MALRAAVGGPCPIHDRREGRSWCGAELLKHAVFADLDNTAAKEVLADVFTQLGYGAENATWRGFNFTGAQELRHGVAPISVDNSAGLVTALTIEQLFDTLAIRVDGSHAAEDSFRIDWRFTDLDLTLPLTLSNGDVLPHSEPSH